MQGLNCTISMRNIIQPDSYYKAISVFCKKICQLPVGRQGRDGYSAGLQSENT